MRENEMKIFFENLGADESTRSKWIIKKQEKPFRAGAHVAQTVYTSGFLPKN
jgi:hypothetical protein